MIRALDPVQDLDAVAALYLATTDFWLMTGQRPPTRADAQAFFAEAPPGSDPARSHHLGLFQQGQLSGVAELSFGFPDPEDAYLGLLLLAPDLRCQGHGARLLAQVEDLARQGGATGLFLAVLDQNQRGQAFWAREGFRPTGRSGPGPDTGLLTHRWQKPLQNTGGR